MYKFMYTRSEILLESAFYGDLVKIDVATDMMYETYIDEMLYADTEEEFNEAGKGIVGTLIQMIGSAIGKIIKFFKDRIANVKKSAGMKKILKTMDSETKDAVIRISSKEKVKLPDTQKAAKLLDQAERGMTAMVDKVSSQIASFEGMKPSKKTKEYDKLLKYVDSACEKIQGIYDEANKVLSTPVEVPVATAFKYMETGVELTERSEKLEKELTKYRDDLVASINKIDLTTESVMAFVDADDDETFEESGNIDLISERLNLQKEYAKYASDCKKAIKAGNYKDAAKDIEECKKILAQVKKAVEGYDKDELSVNLIGALLGYLGYLLKQTLLSIGVALPVGAVASIGSAAALAGGPIGVAFGGAAVAFASTVGMVANIALVLFGLYRVFEDLDANMKDAKKKKEGISINILNGIYNKSLVVITKMEKTLDKLASTLKSAKADKEGSTNESAMELNDSILVELSRLYSEGVLDADDDAGYYFGEKTAEDYMALIYEESVEDEDDSLYEEKQKDKVVETALAEADSATKTKGVVGRTLSGISTFIHNHAKVIAITIGSVATAAGTILVLHKTGVDEKIANKLKKAEKTGEILKGDVVDVDGKVVSGKALKNIGNALKNSRGSQKGVGDSRSGQRRLTSKDTVASYSDPLIRSLWSKDLKVGRS